MTLPSQTLDITINTQWQEKVTLKYLFLYRILQHICIERQGNKVLVSRLFSNQQT